MFDCVAMMLFWYTCNINCIHLCKPFLNKHFLYLNVTGVSYLFCIMLRCRWVPGPSIRPFLPFMEKASSDTLLMVAVNDFFVSSNASIQSSQEQHIFLFCKLFACRDMSNSRFDVLFTHFLAGLFILFISSKTIVQSSVLPTPRTYTSDLDWQSQAHWLSKGMASWWSILKTWPALGLY